MKESFKRRLNREDGDDAVAGLMRSDLHVHSKHSGPADLPVLRHVGRESYSEPRAVYEIALARGMDLVTLTDHDTVEGALELASLPHTFVSEEVTVLLPGGRQLHVNAFDITEAQHERIAEKRRDPEGFFAFLAEESIPASVNHLYSALTGPRDLADLHLPLKHLALIEALNGSMPSALRLVALVALAPLLPLVPLVTALVYLHERRFGERHFRAFEASVGGRVRRRPLSIPRPALQRTLP